MWLSKKQAKVLSVRHGTPLFVYSRTQLQQRARQLTELELPFGATIRYAIKANLHPGIVDLFDATGLYFDASSSYEAEYLLNQGISGSHISLSSQQPAHNLSELLAAGVRLVATSMHQLELFAAATSAQSHVALRVNPAVGGGHNNRTTTGGVNSSFGLWHEYVGEALRFAAQRKVIVDRLHVHIGSGADSSIWDQTIGTALDLVRNMPDVTTVDIGGGFKIKRFGDEREADMSQICEVFAQRLLAFAASTGRKIHLEIEPGTWLVAHAGILLAEIVDIVDTGKQGHTFLRLNTGMNDIMRPAMYGAQHNIIVLNDTLAQAEYIVVGHNCETGDILTPAPGDPERIIARRLNRAAIGDLVAIADAGAYCASFSAKGYNAFPTANEVLV